MRINPAARSRARAGEPRIGDRSGSKLRDLLLDLALDPRHLERFRANPAEVLSHAGLSGAEQAAVESGDHDRIASALGQEDYDI